MGKIGGSLQAVTTIVLTNAKFFLQDTKICVHL